MSIPTRTISETGSADSDIWVLGGGKFGLKSARALGNRHPGRRIIVVDVDAGVCRRAETLGFDAMHQDGIDFMLAALADPPHPRWIVPVIPEHVAYLWVRAMLETRRPIRSFAVPEGVIDLLPNPMAGTGGEIYLSFADFECPEDCPEPAGICTHTGKPRLGRLFQCCPTSNMRPIDPWCSGAASCPRESAVSDRNPCLIYWKRSKGPTARFY